VLVARPSPKDLAQSSPGKVCLFVGLPKQTNGEVSPWRAPAASAGFARCTTSGCTALLADRLVIEETEPLQSSQETLQRSVERPELANHADA